MAKSFFDRISEKQTRDPELNGAAKEIESLKNTNSNSGIDSGINPSINSIINPSIYQSIDKSIPENTPEYIPELRQEHTQQYIPEHKGSESIPETILKYIPEYMPEHIPDLERTPKLSSQASKIYQYLAERRQGFVSARKIMDATGIPLNTIYKMLLKLRQIGCLSYKKENTQYKGFIFKINFDIKVIMEGNEVSIIDKSICQSIGKSIDHSIHHSNSKSDKSIDYSTYHNINHSNNKPPILEEEEIYNLLLSDFPDMYSTLGTILHDKQIKQIISVWKSRNWAIKDLYTSLSMADFAVSNNKDGKIKNPAAYVMKCLLQGYFQRPVGYITPEEKIAQERLREAETLKKLAEQEKQLRYDGWKESLSAVQLMELLKTIKADNKGDHQKDALLWKYFSENIYEGRKNP